MLDGIIGNGHAIKIDFAHKTRHVRDQVHKHVQSRMYGQPIATRKRK